MARAETLIRRKDFSLTRKKATKFLSRLEEEYKDSRFKIATWTKTTDFDDNDVCYFFVYCHLKVKSTWYKSDQYGQDPKKVPLSMELHYLNEEASIKEHKKIKKQVSSFLKEITEA